MHNTVQGARRVTDPCVEPNSFNTLVVFVSPVAAVSITFSCPLESLPLSFSVFAARFCICCAFLYLQRVSVFAARFCICCAFLYLQRVCVLAARFCICCAILYLQRVSVMCCVVKLMKMFSYFACVLSTCMCFL